MDLPALNAPNIILGVGIFCVFLGVFGGGFQIKEISIPKINNISRAMGAVFGLALIVWSQIGVKNPDQVVASPSAATQSQVPETNQATAQVTEQPAATTSSGGLTVKIDELKPLWDNLEIGNNDILQEYLKIKEDSNFEALSLIYKSEVNNKVELLNKSIVGYGSVHNTLNDESITLNEKVEFLNKFFNEDMQTIRLSQRDKEEIELIKNDFVNEIENSARIETANDFLTCESIVNKNCGRSTSLFKTPTVSVWMKLGTPANTEVTLRWIALENGEEINSRKYTVPKSTGYRISSSKSIDKSGHYELRLFNKKSQLIAKKQFEVRL